MRWLYCCGQRSESKAVIHCTCRCRSLTIRASCGWGQTTEHVRVSRGLNERRANQRARTWYLYAPAGTTTRPCTRHAFRLIYSTHRSPSRRPTATKPEGLVPVRLVARWTGMTRRMLGWPKEGKGSSSGGGGGLGVCSVADKQLSGQKRGGGGIEIEKQKSFTGSYFQVRSSLSEVE